MKEVSGKIQPLKTAKDLDKTLFGVTKKTLKTKPREMTPEAVIKNI